MALGQVTCVLLAVLVKRELSSSRITAVSMTTADGCEQVEL